jgi:HD-GYP domain-containing protein (c-di-GMP phosphodiesterase class II)
MPLQNWPDSFDFETDEICQSLFRPFILEQLEKLKTYDAARPKDITYIFYEHAERVAQEIRKTCVYLGLGDVVAENMYWAVLPHDIGKIKLPAFVWDTPDKPGEDLKKLRRSHTELGVMTVQDALKVAHPFKDLMTDIMLNHHEQLDGMGYRGLKANQLSMPVRLAAIVEAFDGWSIRRPHFGERDISIPAVLDRMRSEKASMFDQALFEAFEEMKLKDQ